MFPGALPAPPPNLDATIVGAIQGALPNAYVSLEPLANGRRVVKVVSNHLNGASNEQKQTLVWDALRAALQQDSQYVSFVVPYGDDEL